MFIVETRQRSIGDVYVLSRFHKNLCTSMFDTFMRKHFADFNIQSIDDKMVRITKKMCPCIVLCLYSTRAYEDIAISLQGVNADDNVPVLLVALQACEKTIKADLLKKGMLPKNNIITDYTDILFADSSRDCYLCEENYEAADDIHRFYLKAQNFLKEGSSVDSKKMDEMQIQICPDNTP
ncbi:uncharacterized protein LOC134279144 [Saccostrea cucullata]|uniref:uncharacterized protein LOC134279144 n=1 Tax=Saccostrea cuccullata TaxID=36930 RepID=UPI002ED014CC